MFKQSFWSTKLLSGVCQSSLFGLFIDLLLRAVAKASSKLNRHIITLLGDLVGFMFLSLQTTLSSYLEMSLTLTPSWKRKLLRHLLQLDMQLNPWDAAGSEAAGIS